MVVRSVYIGASKFFTYSSIDRRVSYFIIHVSLYSPNVSYSLFVHKTVLKVVMI